MLNFLEFFFKCQNLKKLQGKKNAKIDGNLEALA